MPFIVETRMDRSTSCRGRGAAVLFALVAVILLARVGIASAETTIMTQWVTNSFEGSATGPLLPYTPFDAATGLLQEARVTVSGVLEGSFIVADPTADPLSSINYHYRISQLLEPSALRLGFGFSSGTLAFLDFSGVAPPLRPFPMTRYVRYEFSVTAGDVPTGFPLSATGVESPPQTIETSLEHFVDTRCGDAASFESAIAMSFEPLEPLPYLVVSGPITYTGEMQIEYTYITTDSLVDHVNNGDFESGSFSPWGSSGAGVARLSSPIECLAATLNQLLELEAGSRVEASQMVATPDDSFRLIFAYGFGQADGLLEVWLGETLLEQIAANNLTPNTFRSRLLSVSDASLLGQSAIPLRFSWDGPSGSLAWIDDVHLYAVPEPARAMSSIVSVMMVFVMARLRRGGERDRVGY